LVTVEHVAVARRPIFIIGSPRSGTTILAWSLAQHSELWTSEETVIIEHLYARGHVDDAFNAVTAPPLKNWLKTEGVSEDELLRNLGIGMNALMSSRSGGKRWIDHTPSYTLIAELLSRMFPDALFLHIVRDGRQVVESMMHFVDAMQAESREARIAGGYVPPWAGDFAVAAATWSHFVDTAANFVDQDPDRCMTVRLEELAADPEGSFSEILRFLQVSGLEGGPARYFRFHRLNSSFPDCPAGAPNAWSGWRLDQKRVFMEEAGDSMIRLRLVEKAEVERWCETTASRSVSISAVRTVGEVVDGQPAVDLTDRPPAGGPWPPAVCSDPVFVFGAPASGASVLARALGAHSMLWFSVAGGFQYALFGSDRLDVIYERSRRSKWSWLTRENVDREEFVRAMGLGMNVLYSSRSQGKRWVEKMPDGELMAPTLAAMFPEGRFLHIVRDGRQAVHSMAKTSTVRRWTHDFRRACRDWSEPAKAGNDFVLGQPGRCLTVRFESLLADPERSIELIFRLLGLPPEAGPADHLQKSEIRSEAAEPTLDPWSEWTHARRRVFLDEAGNTMRELGMLTVDELEELVSGLDA
jgi:hypothetical protein